LRRRDPYQAILRSFAAGKERFGFRLILYSVQSNHVHLIIESVDRRALSRGMQGLQVRIARSLNRVWRRTGSVFEDHFHDRPLKTPREVRHALAYVLNNCHRHGIHTLGPDPYSSGAWFEGWRGSHARTLASPVTARARVWLLTTGWKRHGLLAPPDRGSTPALPRGQRSSRAP
jgi:REP element-mobilizing transposase RayT